MRFEIYLKNNETGELKYITDFPNIDDAIKGQEACGLLIPLLVPNDPFKGPWSIFRKEVKLSFQEDKLYESYLEAFEEANGYVLD